MENQVRSLQRYRQESNKLEASDFVEKPLEWLAKHARANAWLLAFADDGVILGKFDGKNLSLSGRAFPQYSPELDTLTLQQAYVFDHKGEVRIWHTGQEWLAWQLWDEPDPQGNVEAFDEEQMLWGTSLADTRTDKTTGQKFSLLTDGRQGLHYALPLEIGPGQLMPDRMHRPLRLQVRNYITYNPQGQAYVAQSRLVHLHVQVNAKGG
ncbi:MAG: TIGR03984 family CRISPR-associated protein [Chloroflexi bacterium]|nr:TIGR03984 family CRISPR-associated protein [Chloroflexota bacterium]